MESQVWLNARKGDQGAIAAILEAHQGLVYSAAIRYGFNSVSSRVDPQDAAQAALIYIYECLVQGSCSEMTEEEFKGFCSRAGRNRANWFVRKERQSGRDVRRTTELFDDSAAIKANQDEVDTAEQVNWLFDFVQQDEQRGPQLAEVLRCIEANYTRKEIAAKLGLTIHQVAQRIKLIQARVRAAKVFQEV